MPTELPSAARSHKSWAGRRVTLMGLGRHGGGLGAAKFLAHRGARLTISDAATAGQLADSLAHLADLDVEALHLGGHDEADFRFADTLVVNPAIRPDHACLALARRSGANLTSEIELFLDACPAPVIAVTGSNGKSTTVTMLAAILQAAGIQSWLGGNLGGSLLDDVENILPQDWVVLELSSFQLAHLSKNAKLPRLAAVTNCTANHLDWHGCWDDYVRAKQRLLAASQVVLNPLDPTTVSWRSLCPGVVRWAWDIQRVPELRVPGEHNRRNAACAAALAEIAGVSETEINRALAVYGGLEHRIEWLAEINGRHFYNDSKSTSPAATKAALHALSRPAWVLAGGVSKGTDFSELAKILAKQARGVGLYGACREELGHAVKAQNPQLSVSLHETLSEAFSWCVDHCQVGEAVLLSPACASFDQYDDFADRGREFCRLVRQLG